MPGSELDRFEEAFDAFILDRACNEEVLNENHDYIAHNRQQIEFFKTLKTFLPEETENEVPHKILRECDDNTNFLVSCGVQCGYKQGFSEGIKFVIRSLTLR
jgi:hypothetical protein